MRIRTLIPCLLAAGLLGCAAPSSAPATKTNVEPPRAEALQTPPTERSERQVIAAVDPETSLFFERGSASLDAAGRTLLRQHAERLKANPKQQVILAGFSDNVGSRAFSLALADKRITTVQTQLREFGVPQRQMRRAVAGVEQNSKACQSEECLRLMRRVEIRYINPR